MHKWQIRIIGKIKTYSNKELLDNALQLAEGDDYDGGMTESGAWEFDQLKSELTNRLRVVGYLQPGENLE